MLLFFGLGYQHKEQSVHPKEQNQPKRLTFDDVKDEIARRESSNGKYKISPKGYDGLRSYGLYQIHSRHFKRETRSRMDRTITLAFDSIFARHGVGTSFGKRVAAAIHDDTLNEELARKIFEIQGINAWDSMRREKTKR
jgi:hypothetical protein